MFLPGNQVDTSELVDYNEVFNNLEGYLSDDEAKEALVNFYRQNISLAARAFLGIDLAPHQELIIKGWFNRSYNLAVWGRGCGKSFMVSVFCALYAIFYPGARIAIISANFRSARLVFHEIIKYSKSNDGALFRQCIAEGGIKRSTDMYEMSFVSDQGQNTSIIRALPLSGERLRGFRATILIVDEALLVPYETYYIVLKPFLVAKQNMTEILRTRAVEDQLISAGVMEEKDREVFSSTNKIVMLSSASYTFEDLYKKHYLPWRDNINENDISKKTKKEIIDQGTYFVSKLSYEAIPEDFLDQAVLNDALKSGGDDNPSFRREYKAEFTDGSESYFSMRKMNECTIPQGEEPTIQIKGEELASYIVSIDPNASDNPSADHFAISLLMERQGGEKPILVHSYAGTGSFPLHIKYFFYIMTNFNVKLIVGDNAGIRQFINIFNDTDYVRERGIDLKFIESWNPNIDEFTEDHAQMLRDVKSEYNLQDGRICIGQIFQGNIRKMNENLQAMISTRKIAFASKVEGNDDAFNKMLTVNIPLDMIKPQRLWDCIKGVQKSNDKELDSELNKDDNSISNFINYQDSMIELTKKECSLVEPKTSATGAQVFDLPEFIKRTKGPTRVRKDNYTTLMLGAWGHKISKMLDNYKVQPIDPTFMPFLTG